MINNGNHEVKLKIIEYQASLTDDMITQLLSYEDDQINAYIIHYKRNLPENIIRYLVESNNPDTIRGIIRSQKNIPPDVLMNIAKDDDYAIEIAKHRPNLEKDILIYLIEHGNYEVKRHVIKNNEFSVEVIKHLIENKKNNYIIYDNLDNYTHMSADMIKYLAEDIVNHIRSADVQIKSNWMNYLNELISFPNISDDVVKYLIEYGGEKAKRIRMNAEERRKRYEDRIKHYRG